MIPCFAACLVTSSRALQHADHDGTIRSTAAGLACLWRPGQAADRPPPSRLAGQLAQPIGAGRGWQCVHWIERVSMHRSRYPSRVRRRSAARPAPLLPQSHCRSGGSGAVRRLAEAILQLQPSCLRQCHRGVPRYDVSGAGGWACSTDGAVPLEVASAKVSALLTHGGGPLARLTGMMACGATCLVTVNSALQHVDHDGRTRSSPACLPRPARPWPALLRPSVSEVAGQPTRLVGVLRCWQDMRWIDLVKSHILC